MHVNSSRTFTFSIVMSIYNVEQYISEAIESILTQTIGFEQHVQLILVDDGSTDNCASICEVYRDLFPANIVFVKKENGGLSSARNCGLRYVNAELVNFFDPDDILSSNALEEVYAFYCTHKNSVDFISIPLVYFEGENGIHPKYKLFGRGNRVINLIAEPYNFMLSSASTFYKSELFADRFFDERLITAEDTEFNTKLELGTPQFGYVCEQGVQYHYRRRLAGGSNVDKIRTGSDVRAWTGITQVFESCFGSREDLKEWEKELIAYELRSRLRDLRQSYFASEAEYKHLLDEYGAWIGRLDDDFILRRSKFIDNKEKKELFLRLKGSSTRAMMEQGRLDISSFKVWLKCVSIESDHLMLEVLFNRFGANFDVVIQDPSGILHNPTKSKDANTSFDKTIGEFTLDETHYRKFALPLSAGTFTFYFQETDSARTHQVHSLVPPSRPPLMNTGTTLAIVRHGFKIGIDGSAITMTRYASGGFRHGLETAMQLQRQGKPKALLRPFAAEHKRFVLINDRPSKAGDNGQALFEYIMNGDDENLKSVTFFVLDRGCPDYRKMKFKNHVVQPRSALHKLLFLNAKLVISSHHSRSFYMPFAHGSKYYADLFNYKFVWLQHGVTKEDISKQANRLNNHDDLIITCASRETAEFLRESYFLEPKQVAETGFARYDKLHDASEDVIAVAPTWRMSLSGRIDSNGYHEPRAGFTESDYYRQYSSLLTDRRLLHLLEERGLTLEFFLHPGAAAYESHFKTLESANVQVISQEDVDYCQVFAQSKAFITDYSSTAFDFAYLNKPLIYFQFDSDKYFEEHYKKGYFDYAKDGFGPISESAEQLIDELERLAETGFAQPDRYRKRIESFFTYNDSDNCSRICAAIKQLLDD